MKNFTNMLSVLKNMLCQQKKSEAVIPTGGVDLHNAAIRTRGGAGSTLEYGNVQWRFNPS